MNPEEPSKEEDPKLAGDMQSLVHQYEDLVGDLMSELLKNRESLTALVNTTSDPSSSTVEKDDLIRNLLSQKDLLTKSKLLSQERNSASLKYIEKLESEANNHSALGRDFYNRYMTKWNDLQSYAKSLDARVEKLTLEADFYKRKVLEAKGAFEALEGKYQMEQRVFVETTKKECSLKMKQLESDMEKMHHVFEEAVEKRIQEEREASVEKQANAVRLLQVQIEQLLIDNEALTKRESALRVENHNIEVEANEGKRQLLKFMTMAKVELEQVQLGRQLSSAIAEHSVVKVNQGTQCEPPDTCSTSCQTSTVIPPPHEGKLKVNWTLDKENSGERISMLQNRLSQLANANANLIRQYKDACDKNKVLERKLKKEESQRAPNVLASNPSRRRLVKDEESTDLQVMKYEVQMKTATFEIQKLREELRAYEEDRCKLIEIVRDQANIADRWKKEVKILASSTLANMTEKNHR